MVVDGGGSRWVVVDRGIVLSNPLIFTVSVFGVIMVRIFPHSD